MGSAAYLCKPMKPIVQISLDRTNIDEALETAALAMRAGVDLLEAGMPLILAEGLLPRRTASTMDGACL